MPCLLDDVGWQAKSDPDALHLQQKYFTRTSTHSDIGCSVLYTLWLRYIGRS